MKRDAVIDLVRKDHWDLAEVRTPRGLALVRYRSPVLSGTEAEGYDGVLTIDWDFSSDGARVTPSTDQSTRMDEFEDRVCEAVEHDAHGVLVAVRTFDGKRHWVLYTSDLPECVARLEAVAASDRTCPVKVATEMDPAWHYLRAEVLKQVQWKK